MSFTKCPNCGYEIDNEAEKPIGRTCRIIIGIFLWLNIPAWIYGCYINWGMWLEKYSTLEFIIFSISTILILWAFGWIGYGLIFNKKPFEVANV